jgi:hypothetical protein
MAHLGPSVDRPNFEENSALILLCRARGGRAGCERPDTIDELPVTSIAGYAFIFLEGLNSVVVPGSVNTIANSAFHYCESLSTVEIGRGVTSIGGKDFWTHGFW